MKITIELDPGELQAATDLINALRSLTNQVQINTSTAPQDISNERNLPSTSVSPDVLVETQRQTPASVPPPGFQPTGAPVSNGPTQPTQQAAAAAAAPSMTSSQPAGPRSVLQNILMGLTDAQQVDPVAGGISMALMARPDMAQAHAELAETFESVALQQQHDPERVELYFQLLAHRLPEALDSEFRKSVLQRVLKHLMKARDASSDKAMILLYAVGFAALARLGCVKLSGAIMTVVKLLAKDSTAPTAMVVLCQLLSSCAAQIPGAENRDALNQVWTSLENEDSPASRLATDANYEYEMSYIRQWRQAVQATGEPPAGLTYQPVISRPGPSRTTPPPGYGGVSHAAGASGTGGGPSSGQHSSSGQGTSGSQQQQQQGVGPVVSGQSQPRVLSTALVLALNSSARVMAWDAATNAVIVSADNAQLTSVKFNANRDTSLFDVPCMYTGSPITCISAHPTRGEILVASNPVTNGRQAPTAGTYLALHSTDTGNMRRAVAARPPGHFIGTTLLLPHEQYHGVTGESLPGGKPVVCLWDTSRLNSGNNPADLPSIYTYMGGHAADITCSTSSTAMPHTFFTGGQDGRVMIWDTRMRDAAGSLATNMGTAHINVSCMDASRHGMLLTAGSDNSVNLWDIRQLASNMSGSQVVPALSMQVQAGACVYKVAYNDSPSDTCAALATAAGLFMLDWTDIARPAMLPAPGHFGPEAVAGRLLQHDVVWAPGAAPGGGLALLGAGSQNIITVFSV